MSTLSEVTKSWSQLNWMLKRIFSLNNYIETENLLKVNGVMKKTCQQSHVSTFICWWATIRRANYVFYSCKTKQLIHIVSQWTGNLSQRIRIMEFILCLWGIVKPAVKLLHYCRYYYIPIYLTIWKATVHVIWRYKNETKLNYLFSLEKRSWHMNRPVVWQNYFTHHYI